MVDGTLLLVCCKNIMARPTDQLSNGNLNTGFGGSMLGLGEPCSRKVIKKGHPLTMWSMIIGTYSNGLPSSQLLPMNCKICWDMQAPCLRMKGL